MNRKQLFARAVSVAAACSLVIGTLGTSMNAYAYGEKNTSENTFQSDTDNSSDYQTWRAEEWEDEMSDSGKIALTPGTDETCLNFAWYSETIGTPAVQIWVSDGTEEPTANAMIVTGESTKITSDNANRQGVVYAASDKVDIVDYLTENTAYCYRYTDNYDGDNTVWSEVYDYETASFTDFSIVLTGDPQIGASSGDEDDQVARDTYNWNKTLETAISICPDAAFLLSAGDQIDTSTTSEEGQLARESEYAGYLFPSVLRSLPVAATVGNHDMNGADYTYHFNNPNSEENLGATAAGGDYYFSYDGVLFISLNSNNRNQEEHRALMEEAVAAYPDATWRVVVFHSDIYGSGEPHADTDASSNRIIFAPLMDEFDIDVCFTGHDHTYSRTYQVYNGTVIDYDTTEDGYVVDPDGTMYITTGSGSGSKYYNLLSYTPYYIAERTNDFLPSFSIVDFTETSLTISTYDYDGNAYADSFTIYKTSDDVSYSEVEEMAAAVDTSLYTTESVAAFETALEEMEALYELLDDPFAVFCSNAYGTDTDPLYGYGSVNTSYRYTETYLDADGNAQTSTTNRLAEGYSTLIDKTIYLQLNGEDVPVEDSGIYISARAAVVSAINSLELLTMEDTDDPTEESTETTTAEDETTTAEDETTTAE
ncbi:MAG: metallophosphoesterase family protein, partial [Lachnospiraceae bacterium]|nr:metallophosphoesterase family protein [Lachnospiraceae bacterium]